MLSMSVEGTTEKVLQFITTLKSIIYFKNFGFIEKTAFLNTTERLQTREKYLKLH